LSGLLPIDEAVRIVLAEARDVAENHPRETRRASLWEAAGLVLAEDIPADRDEPAFDRAMMDGFAVAAREIPPEGATLPVVATLAAGSPLPLSDAFELRGGEAAAIMTGAAMPRGADAVVILERCVTSGDRVFVPGPVVAGANVVPRGAHVRAGQVVAERGRVVESLTAGVLATVGAAGFLVYRRPRVTVLATGDELVPVEETPRFAQIRDSNRRALMGLAEEERCRVVDGGLVPDTKVALREAVAEGLASDVLLLSGGVSKGAFDLVHEALVDAGVDVLFHKVAMKPGKPLLFGRRGRTLVFGLPGNPVSAWVTAALCVAPALRVLGHRPVARNWHLELPLLAPLPATGDRTTFHAARLGPRPDGARDAVDFGVEPLDWRGSSDHLTYARGHALIRAEAGAPARAPGERVTVILPRPSPV
jgi:molybdopterin molybdotransferase